MCLFSLFVTARYPGCRPAAEAFCLATHDQLPPGHHAAEQPGRRTVAALSLYSLSLALSLSLNLSLPSLPPLSLSPLFPSPPPPDGVSSHSPPPCPLFWEAVFCQGSNHIFLHAKCVLQLSEPSLCSQYFRFYKTLMLVLCGLDTALLSSSF